MNVIKSSMYIYKRTNYNTHDLPYYSYDDLHHISIDTCGDDLH